MSRASPSACVYYYNNNVKPTEDGHFFVPKLYYKIILEMILPAAKRIPVDIAVVVVVDKIRPETIKY